MAAMNEYFASLGAKKKQPKPVRSFKMKRAQMQHLETLKGIAEADDVKQQETDSDQQRKA